MFAYMLALWFFLMVIQQAIACPPSESIAPFCHCSEFLERPTLICNRILNPDELVGPIRAAAASRSLIDSLTIQNSSLLYVPGTVFKDTGIQKIFFLSSEVMSLSDGDVAFEGLEYTLTEIRATNAHYIAQWDWSQLGNLKELQVIDVNWISMESVSEPFPELTSLKFLGIIHAEISFVVDYAFSNLSKLQVLNLKENDITELKRNMLPEVAYDLTALDFSHNELSTLPENFFRNMPSLSVVNLDSNKFHTLHENQFSWAIRNLQVLTMSGNAIRCDCRLIWMTRSRFPYKFMANCAFPEILFGKHLKDLNTKSLWC